MIKAQRHRVGQDPQPGSRSSALVCVRAVAQEDRGEARPRRRRTRLPRSRALHHQSRTTQTLLRSFQLHKRPQSTHISLQQSPQIHCVQIGLFLRRLVLRSKLLHVQNFTSKNILRFPYRFHQGPLIIDNRLIEVTGRQHGAVSPVRRVSFPYFAADPDLASDDDRQRDNINNNHRGLHGAQSLVNTPECGRNKCICHIMHVIYVHRSV